MMKAATRIKQLGIAVDQVANVLIGLFLPSGGWADECISARAWRCQDDAWGWRMAYIVIDIIAMPFERDHCRRAYESEKARRQMPPEYRP